MSATSPWRRCRAALAAAILVAAGACGPSTEADTAEADPTTFAPAIGVPTLDGVHMQLREVAELQAPVALAARPGSTTLYLAEKDGRVRRLGVERRATPEGVVVRASFRLDAEPVIDLTSEVDSEGERGLLGLAFSPDGAQLYVYWTDRSGTLTLDAYRMSGEWADTGSRRNVLSIEHPQTNHNGGQLAFGPDGFLYVGIGDGGGAGDPDGNGQNPHTLLGSIIRIDPAHPSGDRPYGIPDTNPYRDGRDGAPEVWAWGLRNPWRFSFDRQTGDLWIGDVGQSSWEEIDFLPNGPDGAGRGANLGWSRMEGSHTYAEGTPPPDHLPPLHDYGRDQGACSVIGGFVYRGATHPDWHGAYVWADYCVGEIRTLLRRPDGTIEERGTGLGTSEGDLEAGGSITSFGEDNDGELYALSAAGAVYLIED